MTRLRLAILADYLNLSLFVRSRTGRKSPIRVDIPVFNHPFASESAARRLRMFEIILSRCAIARRFRRPLFAGLPKLKLLITSAVATPPRYGAPRTRVVRAAPNGPPYSDPTGLDHWL